MNMCHLGCGLIGVFTNKSGKFLCHKTANACPEVKRKNSLKQKESYASGQRKKINYELLSEESKNKMRWNKGLTKDSHPSIKKLSEFNSKRMKGKKGNPCSEERKIQLSILMKERHAKGLAHNIGSSRWNNKPSYPEQFFIKVIENEFDNKNYIREFSFGKFSLDFAWVNLKKCIEIDGEQHERFEEQKRRDKEKDELLKNNGWKILRIRWKDMYHNPKEFIKIAKEFINHS